MSLLRIVYDQAAARRLLKDLAQISSPAQRARYQRNACNAAGGVYKRAVIGASPVRHGFLKKSWTVARWKVKKTNAEYAVLVKPNPKHVRYVDDKTGKILNATISRAIDKDFTDQLKAARQSKNLLAERRLTKQRRDRNKIRPSKYAHLTESGRNNKRTHGWAARAARRVEATALKAFIASLQKSLRGKP